MLNISTGKLPQLILAAQPVMAANELMWLLQLTRASKNQEHRLTVLSVILLNTSASVIPVVRPGVGCTMKML